MSRPRVEDIRNVVLVGHGAVGKTALADQMLFKAGANSRAGSVEDGSSVLDFDEEAKAHKYTITSSLCHFTHHGKHLNLINTPGYPDYIGQVLGALRAAETAVIVINAAAGIEVNTRKVFHLSGQEGLGRMIVLNKLDQENVRFPELIESIQNTFGKNCVLMNVPDALGPKFSKVYSTLEHTEHPKDLPLDPDSITQSLMDAIVECDEALMVRYLDGEAFSHDEISHAVEHALAAGTLIPIFCTCAKSGVGVPELMEALAEDALLPTDLHRKAADKDKEVEVVAKEDAPLVAQVFKTRIDPFVSKMSFVRIYSGKLAKDATVTNTRSGKSLKIGGVFHMQGNQQQASDVAGPGEIVVVVKMDDLQVGDTLVDGKNGQLVMPPIKFPHADGGTGHRPQDPGGPAEDLRRAAQTGGRRPDVQGHPRGPDARAHHPRDERAAPEDHRGAAQEARQGRDRHPRAQDPLPRDGGPQGRRDVPAQEAVGRGRAVRRSAHPRLPRAAGTSISRSSAPTTGSRRCASSGTTRRTTSSSSTASSAGRSPTSTSRPWRKGWSSG